MQLEKFLCFVFQEMTVMLTQVTRGDSMIISDALCSAQKKAVILGSEHFMIWREGDEDFFSDFDFS